ncbi:MAG: Single-stranded nucleic acid binding R3H domain-containing protein [Candidatus Levybacteria bacterium GW2011_GWA2_37_36]|nr:MAG: Single-stranded nucleic acid binding R3H domain-containing protein [Candidatus Levybacteria bacterium GW2011_GWA1_37_16]KKQ32951.1 MAG: Single-stranded nucleic acid binding R3H domain-containing protein [Candidatus Levybacteria bacterium GW2011_GWA2_37_36]
MDKKEIKTIQEVTEKLLKLLDVDGDFEILESKESKEESVEIVLNTKDTGVVIGYHGDTLEGLQLVLSLCVARNLGRFVRISIDVGDYKKNRTEFLKTLAQETKERALAEGKEIAVPELKSWERRIVHLLLEKDEEVVSESQGEGRDRVLIVRPKAK